MPWVIVPGVSRVGIFADVIETGTVLGVDANLGPDVAADVFGANTGENRFSENFWHVYGFLEIFWLKRPSAPGYQGHHFTVQADRFGGLDARFISKAVRSRYGLSPFKRPLHFAELKPELDRRGVSLVPTTRDDDYQTYLQPESGVTVMVLIDNGYYEYELGHISKITSPTGYAHAETRQRQANAIDKAAEVANLQDWQPQRYAELREELPSADELVRDCLDALPTSRSAALTRTNKLLIDVASAHRHNISDPGLRRELDDFVEWRRRRARLMLPF